MSRRLTCRPCRAALPLAAALLASLCAAPQAHAAASTAQNPGTADRGGMAAGAVAPVTLSVSGRPGHPAELILTSRLAGRSGSEGGSVAFFVLSREFGSPANVPIGTAKMAADGTASLTYTPTWSGSEEFLARLPGAHAPTATAHYDVTASTPGPLYAAANPGKPLASIGVVFLNAIRGVVALIWLSLILILVMVRARMPRLDAGENRARE